MLVSACQHRQLQVKEDKGQFHTLEVISNTNTVPEATMSSSETSVFSKSRVKDLKANLQL